jgi:hypothetical protein
MEGMAQWSMSDLARLVAEGRRAATEALDASELHDERAPGT